MLRGVVNNYAEIDTIKKGVATLRKIKVSEKDAKYQNIRTLMNYGHGFELLCAGEYIQLIVNGELMMSDTPMELRTNMEFVRNANGEVMIAGLGVGMVLENLIPLCESGKVTKVVVYEKYQDVIDLVAHRYTNRMPLEVRLADIMEYKPPKDEKYDTLYFDIWPTIDEDNLKDVRILHNRWKSRKKEGAWMGSWMADFLRARRKAESARSGWY